MRVGLSAVVAALVVAVGSGASATVVVGEPEVLTPHGFERQMKRNPELAAYVARRGYPDWVERVEVDHNPPLAAYEIRTYYLRLNKEVTFTRAYILDTADIGLQLSEYPLSDAIRARIQQAILDRSPDLRAELAADRAIVAAQSVEESAGSVERAAGRVESIAARMESMFDDQLYK